MSLHHRRRGRITPTVCSATGQSQAIDGKCRVASDILASTIDAHSGADVTAQMSGQAVRSVYRLLAAIGLIADVGEHRLLPVEITRSRAIGSSQYDVVVGASRGPRSRGVDGEQPAKRDRFLTLLRHVRGRRVPARRGAWQAGQRGSQRAMTRAIASRMVAKLSAK